MTKISLNPEDVTAISNARHVTFCDGTTPVTGTVTSGNSFLGTVSSGILDYVPDRVNNRFAIQKPAVNTVTIYPVIASCNNPSLPTLSATSSSICEGNSTTLSVSAGTLNDATDWHWYTGSCGGTSVGTGTSLNVSPTSTTTYYVRGEGGCVSPGLCEEITITVNSVVTPSVSIAANPGISNNTGTSVTFTATPTNGGTPTYQWMNNGTPISGETAATYTGVAGTDFVDNDIISCEMTSSAACASPTTVTSNTLTMDVTISAAGFATGFGFPTTNEVPNAITKDGTGNIYVGGTVGNTGFISKFSSTGTEIWTKIYGTVVNGVVVNQSGNPVIVGGFTNTTTFGGLVYTFGSANSTDAFVAVLDATNGNVNSAVKIGAGSIDLANAIAIDDTDQLYVVGEFNVKVDFDPSPSVQNRSSKGLRDIFVLKLDANLAFQWVYTVGGGSTDKAFGVAVGDEVYVTGQYSNGMSGLTSAGSYDGFITKLSKSSGTMIWETSFGNASAYDNGKSIALDASNNIYVCGLFTGSLMGLTSNGSNPDALIFSYDNLGNFRWANKGGGTGSDIANSISVNGTEVLTTGFVRSGTGSFTGAPNGLNGTSGTNDVFVVKYHTDGTFACLRLMSGAGDQEGRAIWAGSGNYALTGTNEGTLGVEIDDLTTIPLTTTGLYDIFVMSGTTCSAGAMKMDNSAHDQSISSEISVYPNPNNGQFNIAASGKFSVKIFDVNGKICLEQKAENMLSVDLGQMSNGLYLVQVNNTTESKSFKIQIQK